MSIENNANIEWNPQKDLKFFIPQNSELLRCVEDFQRRRWESNLQPQINIYKDGILLPVRLADAATGVYHGGACDRNQKFVGGLISHKDWYGWFNVVDAYKVSEEQVKTVNESVIFGGILTMVFGHFLLECMASRLWYVLKNPERKEKIVFVKIHDKSPQWVWDFFSLLGIPKERIDFVKEPTRYSQLIVPEECVHSSFDFTYLYRTPYEIIKKNLPQSPYKKIYLSRSLVHTEVFCVNEEYFEDFYRKKGFLVIHPEKYSVIEQAALVHGCEEIVCTLGTISHWVLVSRPGTELTVLMRSNNRLLNAQRLVNEAAYVNCTWVDVSMNFLYPGTGNGVFLLGESKYWKEYVKVRYKEEICTATWKGRCVEYITEWCKYWMSNSSRANRMLSKTSYYGMFGALYEYFSDEELSEDIKHMIMDCYDKGKSKKDYGKIIYNIFEEETGRTLLSYEVHSSFVGWQDSVIEGEIAGTLDNRGMEALRFSWKGEESNLIVKVHDYKHGWSQWRKAGEVVGTTGKALSLNGVALKLEGLLHEDHDINYRVHGYKLGWSIWAENGKEIIVRDDYLNGIQVRIVRNR